jgi:hypothetical protein
MTTVSAASNEDWDTSAAVSMRFALPKRGKARTVPLPEVVAVALAEHIRRFPRSRSPYRGPGRGAVR